jgi:hypothetical protein
VAAAVRADCRTPRARRPGDRDLATVPGPGDGAAWHPAAPQVLVLGDEGFTRHFLDLAWELGRGRTPVLVSRSATTVGVIGR